MSFPKKGKSFPKSANGSDGDGGSLVLIMSAIRGRADVPQGQFR
jgi:hypothetical protein